MINHKNFIRETDNQPKRKRDNRREKINDALRYGKFWSSLQFDGKW